MSTRNNTTNTIRPSNIPNMKKLLACNNWTNNNNYSNYYNNIDTAPDERITLMTLNMD